MPGIGPVSEREINIHGGFGSGKYLTEFSTTGEITGKLHSFYFIHNAVVYFAPCFNVEQDAKNPELRNMTFCIAIFDSPSVTYGNWAIELINQYGVDIGTIIYDLSADRPDLEWGNMDAIVKSVGQFPPPEPVDNKVRFGFGLLRVFQFGRPEGLILVSPTTLNHGPSFEYPVDDQMMDINENFAFKVQPIQNAEAYLWGFFLKR